MQEQKHVVIVGGGFGGLNVAKVLANRKQFKITLIDRRNYHLFQPLLYQVATAALSPAEIAVPIRTLFSNDTNVTVLLSNATEVDLKNRKLKTQDGDITYDYLVLACGAKHSYFNHEEWETQAPGLKTLEQATEIRRRILLAFEEAEKQTTPSKQKFYLSFVIVGGGPTGVELAGAVAEISRYTLESDFRHIDPTSTRVILLEAGSRILAGFKPELSARAARDLEKLGVQIWTNSRVTEISDEGVKLGNEEISAFTVIWAAGVKASSLGVTLGTQIDSMGRVIVESDLSVPGNPNVFVIGDQALAKDEHGQTLPGVAAVAMQQGRYVAKVIMSDDPQKLRKLFHYKDKGLMATIGRKKAVVQIGQFKFGGFVAWLLWLFVHIYYLIGFKNKLFVLIQWAWVYFTFKRGARLILAKEWKSQKF